jgi:prepilin-type N-terminal cleavage/methylation domain-containing protein
MRRRHAVRGFTLTELLVSITISALIMGVIGLVFIASVRTWNRVSSRGKSAPQAFSIIYRINRELRLACAVETAALGDRVTYWLPKTLADKGVDDPGDSTDDDINYVGPNGLEPGRKVEYYLSNDTGSSTVVGGHLLWRRETTNGVVRLTQVAREVAALNFVLVNTPGGQTYGVYSTAVTITGTEGATVTNSTISSNIAIRNPCAIVPTP